MLRRRRATTSPSISRACSSRRCSRARPARARIVGFSIWHLREKTARPFYSDVHEAEGGPRHHEEPAAAARDRRRRRRDPVSAGATSVARRSTSCGATGRTPVRADQSRRGVAEQAMAGRALRRARGFLHGACGLDAGRAVGAGRRSGSPTSVIAASASAAIAAPPYGHCRSRRAVARRRARGVGRHRSAAHRDRRRHADGQSLRPDRSGRGTVPSGQRRRGVALRGVRLPLRPRVPRNRWCLARRRGGGGLRGRAAPSACSGSPRRSSTRGCMRRQLARWRAASP